MRKGLSLDGVVGKLLYLAGPSAAGPALAVIAPGSVLFAPAALVVAGPFFSPVMIVAYICAHTAGGEHQQNSATTWVNTGHNLGSATGSALAGVLIQSTGTPTAILSIGIAAAVLLATSAVLTRG